MKFIKSFLILIVIFVGIFLEARTYYKGPRGGEYYVNEFGNKIYVKRGTIKKIRHYNKLIVKLNSLKKTLEKTNEEINKHGNTKELLKKCQYIKNRIRNLEQKIEYINNNF